MTRSAGLILARVLLCIYLICIAILCFSHFEHMPEVQKSILGVPTDKVVHFMMFLPFPILAYLSYGRFSDNLRKTLCFVLISFAVGVGIAFLTEFLQGFLPYRSKDGNDLLADILALTASSIIVLLIDIHHLKQRSAPPCANS